jgi:hypothetical protein
MALAPASTAARPARLPAGWPIVGWSTLIVAALASSVLLAAGGGEAGWRAVIRLTARTSLILFTAAFIASSLRALWHTPMTRWLLANRRYVGVSFAASHALHLVGIVALSRMAADFRLGGVAAVGGGLAYVFLAAMTATSSDRAVAWLGARRWRLLHKSGMYYCWFIFFITYAPRVLLGWASAALYAPFIAILLGALALRAAARQRSAASGIR